MGKLSQQLETVLSDELGLPVRLRMSLRGINSMKISVIATELDKQGMARIKKSIRESSSILQMAASKYLERAAMVTFEDLIKNQNAPSLRFSSKEEQVKQAALDLSDILGFIDHFRLSVE